MLETSNFAICNEIRGLFFYNCQRQVIVSTIHIVAHYYDIKKHFYCKTKDCSARITLVNGANPKKAHFIRLHQELWKLLKIRLPIMLTERVK